MISNAIIFWAPIPFTMSCPHYKRYWSPMPSYMKILGLQCHHCEHLWSRISSFWAFLNPNVNKMGSFDPPSVQSPLPLIYTPSTVATLQDHWLQWPFVPHLGDEGADGRTRLGHTPPFKCQAAVLASTGWNTFPHVSCTGLCIHTLEVVIGESCSSILLLYFGTVMAKFLHKRWEKLSVVRTRFRRCMPWLKIHADEGKKDIILDTEALKHNSYVLQETIQHYGMVLQPIPDLTKEVHRFKPPLTANRNGEYSTFASSLLGLSSLYHL